tara:strand:+ start:62422 stop:63720 length:1299 start_codon:yes stop_codon:yes gene_type:complete
MSENPHVRASCLAAIALILTLPLGCRKSAPTTADVDVEKATEVPETFEALSYEVTGAELLASRLEPEQAADGWIRLFDGHTLFGWEITGEANWHIEDESIVVDRGRKCLLCTSTEWQDYELTLEFKAGKETNSGVFLRTQLDPESVQTDCYEINIAPDDNPFPTASIVQRQKVDTDKAPEQTFDTWRRMTMRVDGKDVQITIDGQVACEYTDPVILAAGRIGLQHNSGRVQFRDIRLRPLGLETLLDKKLSKWKKYPDMPGEFTTTQEGALHVKGGSAQLETKDSFDDFVLLAQYKLPSAEINSGIFFRCIPGDKMMGYECQVSNEMKDGKPLSPADCGTGGIFRRQDARVIAGEPDQWATVVLTARGPTIAAWVNGIQVSNWTDTREPHENPRKGMRLEPGTIMIQGHDETTDATFGKLSIAVIDKSLVAE